MGSSDGGESQVHAKVHASHVHVQPVRAVKSRDDSEHDMARKSNTE